MGIETWVIQFYKICITQRGGQTEKEKEWEMGERGNGENITIVMKGEGTMMQDWGDVNSFDTNMRLRWGEGKNSIVKKIQDLPIEQWEKTITWGKMEKTAYNLKVKSIISSGIIYMTEKAEIWATIGRIAKGKNIKGKYWKKPNQALETLENEIEDEEEPEKEMDEENEGEWGGHVWESRESTG